MTESNYAAIDAWDELISTLYGNEGKRQIEILIERMELGLIPWLPAWTVIIGGPGTGKTTLTRIIWQMFNNVTIPMAGYKPTNYGEYNAGTLGLCTDADFNALYEHVTKNWHVSCRYHLLVETNKDVLLLKEYTPVDINDTNYIFKKDCDSSMRDIEIIRTTGKRIPTSKYLDLVHTIEDGILELQLYFRQKASRDYVERLL